MEKLTSHKDLKVWQKGIDLVVLIYEITNIYPKEELYALMNQMRRCASSIPANIAEGAARRNTTEFRQFLHISLGSASELETFLIISERLGYLNGDKKDIVTNLLDEVMRMLVSLIKRISNKL